MSSQKGNAKRSRPQKYQNTHAFKNTLHDTSHQTKFINNIQVVNVCERCKSIIEWKIKYKKYKPLKAPAKCTKCDQKSVKYAYHMMCGPCAKQSECCPKCGVKEGLVQEETKEEVIQLDRELRLMLKKLPERKRRTFLRYMNRKASEKKQVENTAENRPEVDESDESDSDTQTITTEERPLTRDDLIAKLKALTVAKKRHDDFDSDIDGDNCSDDSSDYSDANEFESSDDDDEENTKK